MNAFREIFGRCLLLVGGVGLALTLTAWVLCAWNAAVSERISSLCAAWKRSSFLTRVVFVAFVGIFVAYASNKPPENEQEGRYLCLISSLPEGQPEEPAPNPCQGETILTREWNLPGAWEYSMRRQDFANGFVFPYGTNHLTCVHVSSQGYLCESRFSTNVIASIGVPVAVVSGLTECSHEYTVSNTYLFSWTNAAVNRDTNTLVSASLELLRNGDIVITTNGFTRTVPRELPFVHDGYGQDEAWVRANFGLLQDIDPSLTNVEQVLSVGYANWVDAMVGVGLTNGLYKFTASFTEIPPETTQLWIGDYSVCVTNAGEYVFLLEKGTDYEFGTWPFDDTVDYYAQDDMAADAPMLMSWWGGWELLGEWSVDGGDRWIWGPQRADWGSHEGYCCMMPTLQGSPGVTHLGPEDFPATFEALLWDIPQNCEVAYDWSADAECFDIEAPHSRTTKVYPKDIPSWKTTSMSVTASFNNKRLTSSVGPLTYGTNSVPTAQLTLSFPAVTFLNDDLRSDRVYPLDVQFSMEVPTNGTIRISHSGGDQVILSDTNSFKKTYTSPCVTFRSRGTNTSFTKRFYVLSRNIGVGSFTATCELADRSQIVRQKSYSVVEPICHYVCNKKGDDGRFLNPSRLVYGTNSCFEVEVRGPYVQTQLVWTVTSGMCDTSKVAWNKVRLKPKATNGVVRLTAKFSDDEHQPSFELPIVTPRVIPVRAFTVPPRQGAMPVSPTRIRRCIALANEIYSQVGVSFNLISIDQNIRTTNDWVLAEYDIDPRTSPTNSPALSAQAISLLNHYTANDCLELYFVGQIINSGAAAFRHPLGIVVSQSASDHAVAHEIGHAFGLLDMYDYSIVNRGVLDQFRLLKPSRTKFSSARDWGSSLGRGFYPQGVSHSMLMRKMLMFGKDGEASLDIPDGAVFSLLHNHTQSISQTNMPPVGASFMIQLNSGVYSK